MLSQICRSSYQNSFTYTPGDVPEDIRRKFDQWWSNQISPQATITPKMLPFMAAPPNVTNDMDFPVGTAAVAAAAAAAAAAAQAVSNNNLPGSRESLLLNEAAQHGVGGVSGVLSGNPAAHHPNMMVHPAMHASMHHHHHHHQGHSQYPSQKTRMRTSFDPEMELPKLQKWFQENPHPSRQQIQTYVVQLNALESRRGRKPLDVNNVVYWFKNARAAQKRAEMRGGLSALGHAMNGYLSQHSQMGQNSSSSVSSGTPQLSSGHMGGGGSLSITHDYLKSPLSLKSEDIDTISQHSDDLDDEQSRPGSPQLPLSLTIHDTRHRNSPTIELDEQQRDNIIKDEVETIDTVEHTRIYNNEDNTRVESKENLVLNDNFNERSRSNSNVINNNNNNNNNNTTTENNNNNTIHSNNNNNNNNNNNISINNNNTSNNNNNSNQSNEDISSKMLIAKEEEEDLDMEDDDDDNDNENSRLDDFRSPSPDMNNQMLQRKDLPFPMVPNSMFSQSFMYMSHYMPGFGQHGGAAHSHAVHHHAAAAAAAAGMQQNSLLGTSGLNLSNLSNEERRKRNRTFIDPVTEVPKLEQWFSMNTHPSHNLIMKYTDDLNTMPYRQKFPRLESKNVQFWFKNRRAKCKRLKMSLYDNQQCSQLSGINSFVHKYEDRD